MNRFCATCDDEFKLTHPRSTATLCLECRKQVYLSRVERGKGGRLENTEDITDPQADPTYYRWSYSAAFCHLSGANCSICPVSTIYGRNQSEAMGELQTLENLAQSKKQAL